VAAEEISRTDSQKVIGVQFGKLSDMRRSGLVSQEEAQILLIGGECDLLMGVRFHRSGGNVYYSSCNFDQISSSEKQMILAQSLRPN